MTRFAARVSTLAVVSIAALAFATLAGAQAYPSRPVKVIVPWPPGQATDIAARLLGQKLQDSLGQPFVMDNRGGAGGSLGTELFARAPADGYTLLAASSGPVSIMPSLQKLPYDPLKEFVLVGVVSRNPYALVVPPNFPASNAKEFIALLRANPDKYTFSSSGTGATAHLITELFNSLAGIKARHIPYKGSAQALTDVINGQVNFTLETVAGTVAHIKSGRLKTFGITTAKRAGGLPDVPTLAEAAGIDIDAGAWIGYAVHASAPREVIARLGAEIQKILNDEEFKVRLVNAGLDPSPMPPESLPGFMKLEQERYAQIIKNAGIKME